MQLGRSILCGLLFILPVLGCGGGGGEGDSASSHIVVAALSRDIARSGRSLTIEGWGFGEDGATSLPPPGSRVLMRDPSTGVEAMVGGYASWSSRSIVCTVPPDFAAGTMVDVIVEAPTASGTSRSLPAFPDAHRLRIGEACFDVPPGTEPSFEIRMIRGLRSDWVLGVGEKGRIALFDGSAWRTMQSGTRDTITDVCPIVENLAYASTATGTILRYDGSRWDDVPLPNTSPKSLFRIVGTTPDDIWAATRGDGDLLHWNGTLWEGVAPPPNSTVSDLLVLPDGMLVILVWSDGLRSRLHHRDGDGWVEFAGLDAHTFLSLMALQVIGTGLTDLWVSLSDHPHLLHYDGTAWTHRTPPGSSSLTAIFSPSENEVWTGNSRGEICHWDGTTWTQEVEDSGFPYVSVLWGASTADLWASLNGFLKHRVGATWHDFALSPPGEIETDWRTVPTFPLRRGLKTGPDDFVVGGRANRLSRLSSTGWTVDDGSQDSPFSFFTALCGTSASDLWAGTESSGVLHFDGTSWSRSTPSTWTALIEDVWTDGGGEVWAVCPDELFYHFDGSSWQRMETDLITTIHFPCFRGFWGRAPNDLYVVGGAGFIAHWDGASWTLAHEDPDQLYLFAMDGIGNDLAMACGGPGSILHFDGTSWRSEPNGLPEDLLFQIHVVSPTEAYAAGSRGNVLVWDGITWTRLPPFTQENLRAVFPTESHGLVVVGEFCELASWDGSSWSRLLPTVHDRASCYHRAPSGFIVQGSDRGMARSLAGESWQYFGFPSSGDVKLIWGRSMEELVVLQDVGQDDDRKGFTCHLHGGVTTSRRCDFGRVPLSMDGTAHDDLWICGEGGLLAHFDGTTWSEVPSGTMARLRRVRTFGPGIGWITGDGGTLLRLDETGWSARSSGTTTGLDDVFRLSEGNLYLLGDGGVLLHGDGSTWTPVSLPTSFDIEGMAGHGPSDLFVSATWNTVLRFDGTSWDVLEGNVVPPWIPEGFEGDYAPSMHYGSMVPATDGEIRLLGLTGELRYITYDH